MQKWEYCSFFWFSSAMTPEEAEKIKGSRPECTVEPASGGMVILTRGQLTDHTDGETTTPTKRGEALKALGEAGWELVSISDVQRELTSGSAHLYVFKRPLPN